MSEALNITTAAFGGLREVTTSPLWQWDYGQILKITGLDLPQAFEVHFSNSRKSGETITQIGTDSQVVIPDMFLTSGADVYAFIFLHDGLTDGETEYVIKVPVRERPEPSDIEPTPEQQDAITEAIAALNDAVDKADVAITHYPQIIDGVWNVWDVTNEEYVSTGIEAGPTDAEIVSAVNAWLDDHPEVQVPDGSITKAKLTEALQYKVNDFYTYYAELDRWEIPNNGTNAEATANINAMIAWAKENGYNAVALPSGTYLIDAVNENYTSHRKRTDAGIIMPNDMALLMCNDTILQVATNDSMAYACITFHDKPAKNILIKGGRIIGDRLTHDFTGDGGGSHEYGIGIFAQSVENLVIDGVYFDGFTGDAIGITNTGSATQPATYFPSKNVKVLNCTIKNSRRNNISVTGGDNVTIAGCYITGAGTEDANHDGTAPRYGIDVEGYGEGDLDFAITRRVFVIGNVFEGNVNAACDFLTGYECAAIGNVSDGLIAYSYGNNIVIADNVFYKNPYVTDGGAAIAGNNPSSGFDGNYTVISGNLINGFQTGISLRGKKVFAIGNRISNVVHGIITYNCSDSEIISNVIDSAKGTNKVDSNGISISQNCSNLIIKSNTIKNGTKGYAIRIPSVNPPTNINIADNDLLNNNVGIFIDGGSEIYIHKNRIIGISSTSGMINIFASVSDVNICGNVLRNGNSYIIKCTAGTSANNRIRICDNIIYLTNEAGIYTEKTIYLDVINNLFICAPTTNNNRDAIIITGDPISGTITNRIIGNVFYCENTNNERYAIKAEKGESFIAENKCYTGAISNHANDTLIDNYPPESTVEQVTGSTPVITGKSGMQYICSEVSTLTVVLPAAGMIDVIFKSGSVATVLTVTPPTGATLQWANGFDPTALDANTTYEINVLDGKLGVACAWT